MITDDSEDDELPLVTLFSSSQPSTSGSGSKDGAGPSAAVATPTDPRVRPKNLANSTQARCSKVPRLDPPQTEGRRDMTQNRSFVQRKSQAEDRNRGRATGRRGGSFAGSRNNIVTTVRRPPVYNVVS